MISHCMSLVNYQIKVRVSHIFSINIAMPLPQQMLNFDTIPENSRSTKFFQKK